MHVQIRPDPVAGAMGEILAVLPQRIACQNIEIYSARSFGKPDRCKGDVPFKDQGEIGDRLL